jgi:hypothetical protein
MMHVMLGRAAFRLSAQPLGQGVAGSAHIGELGLTAPIRDGSENFAAGCLYELSVCHSRVAMLERMRR